jgi:hypothetical protein
MSLLEIIESLPQNSPLTWVPFNPGHVMTMDLDKSLLETVSRVVPLEVMLENQATHGHAITVILHGKPAAVFGTVSIWEGVGEMWMLCEERFRKYGKSMTRAALAYTDCTVIAGNLHRLQITVRCADLRAVRWAMVLGFEIEGMMKRYGPDQSDFYLMSKT